jgi:hypothetical protein
MTMPDERYRAIQQAAEFLQRLLNPKLTPNVPKPIRSEARLLLRHFPSEFYLEELAAARPDIISPRMDELHKWVLSNDPTNSTDS